MKPPKMTDEDLHNIFDLLFMIDYGTLKINGMDKWASKFLEKLEPYVLEDKKEKKEGCGK